MRPLPGHPQLGSSRSIAGPLLLDLCRACMEAGARRVRFPLRGISMLPTLDSGDVAIVEPLDERPPRPGEIILFESPEGRPVVHRVVHTALRGPQLWVVTACDLSPSSLDDPVPISRVVGRVTAAEREGRPLPLEGRRFPALSVVRARFRVAFAGRPRPVPALRRAVAWALQAATPLAEGLTVIVSRLLPDPGAELRVTVDGGRGADGRWTLGAWVGDRCLARLELKADATEEWRGAWVILGPRLWPNRPGRAGETLLRHALELAAQGGATHVFALSRRGWHVRTHLLRQVGFRPFAAPELLDRLVHQAQEGDSRRREWLLLKADLTPESTARRSPQ